MVKPAARRNVVLFLGTSHGMSERRACGLARMDRSSFRYRARRSDDGPLRHRLRELAAERPRYGYRRLHILLCREGVRVNRKRVQRIYREEELMVRRKKRKRVAQMPRQAMPVPDRPNVRWAIDFMQDTLADGRTFRLLNIVDDFTREAVAIEVATSIPGDRVVRVLERLRFTRGLPEILVSDNGPSSQAGRSTRGRTRTGFDSTSSSQTSLPRMPLSRASMGASGKSVSTRAGSPTSWMQRDKSKPGESIPIGLDPIAPWGIKLQKNSRNQLRRA